MENDTNISHLLQEIEDPEDSFLGETNFQLQLSVHNFEDSYMIRFKPQPNAQSKKEYETGHWDRNTNLPNQKYFLNHFGKQITEDESAMNGHFSFLISISNPDSIISKENNPYFEYIYAKVADRLKKYLNRNDHLFRIENDKFLISSAHADSEIKAEWFAECIQMLFDFSFHLRRKRIPSQREYRLHEIQFQIRVGYERSRNPKRSSPEILFARSKFLVLLRSKRNRLNFRKSENRNRPEKGTKPKRIGNPFSTYHRFKREPFFFDGNVGTLESSGKGKLLPGSFISIAESSSFIKTIGEWMIWETFRYYENSILKSENISLSLNISPKQLGDKNIFPLLKEASNFYKIQPSHIILEIVEDSFDSRESQIGKVITSLKDYGFKFAIDDFGKGYSSLGRLIQLPIDYIKLDKIFLFNYFQTSTRAVITSMVNLVQAMGKAIIVEGVENEIQHKLLRELNCNFGQGYYYSHPVEIDLAEKLVRNKEIPFS
ncbi:cyclic diguanylate phosphodiesterase (EAL) domain protein [Leptospira borgpetersenii serovar Pomona str. 200901868]|uniref:Cyclic diguanylate phosphodiesterase (EAL) domain protein n=1 Tax=Leptospira borgpetersenii serovar Pomona str. 200901868 TaxID=1192866 RepID=M6W3V0_LEPBO|nr:cyclic diguanylate phosphodiesterase (EAL) domain protein [Leptospira borgpetersenii serovar Pomona str. 200901868]